MIEAREIFLAESPLRNLVRERDQVHFEQSVYALARKVDPRYRGGDWGFYEISDMVFMAPKSLAQFQVLHSGRLISVTPIAFGLNVTLETLRSLTVIDKFDYLSRFRDGIKRIVCAHPEYQI
ncbi:hypothetical protein [Teredinibacter purpureus]|uniref:hypothetical protein n=1 Tax=Teredinibacter purpureus TaxID=2731756 RepID=UPI0005F7891D|nr:hypothetical protein [Teredinibacter purpureus]